MYNVDPARLRPLSPLAYVGYGLLYLIPGIGLICAIIVAVKTRNLNLRSYSQACLIALVALIVAVVVVGLVLFSRGCLADVIRRIPAAFRVLFP